MMKDAVDYISPDNFGAFFLEGNPEKIYKQCNKDFKKLVTIGQFKELVQSYNQNVESYQLIDTTLLGSSTQYLWLDNHSDKAISVAFDSMNTIQHLLLKPYITFPESDNHYSKNTYIMPIKNEWFVFWGGTNEFINYHYIFESQRYAYDLVVMKDKQTYKNNTMRNKNYFAFEQEVVAPADGKVLKVINTIIDNTPGEMNESQPAGNYVILEHPNKEYSLLAHFKQQSIAVKEGDVVKQGQIIGLCGNSGNSSEPHIHFQVMDSPDYMTCRSIRIRFNDGLEPIQGDTVTQSTQKEKEKMDTFDKVENAFTLADVFLLIPRIIGSFFK
ncbi:M23 family metallopeptidase [Paucisalibacillus globulus]|uniref:M23 family metallopeptidase n=1 Tax=Paucisalibacillus globulus TaxID=351095 RepID=UPI00041C30B4|nr:M23 family metallopeptidase [Paucisalibacillus globulus]